MNPPLQPTHNRFIFYGIVALLHLGAIAIRIYAIPHVSSDIRLGFFRWYEYIDSHGGFRALGDNFNNYTPFYSYLLVIMAALKSWVPPLTAIKLIPIIFDFLAAGTMYHLVNIKYKSSSICWAAYFCVLYAPTVILNGSYWGQIDMGYSSLLLLSVLIFIRGNNTGAMLIYSLAFAFKLQSIFLAPFILVLLIRRIISWKHLLWTPLVYILLGLPCYLLGRPWASIFEIYSRQSDWGRSLSYSAPNLYSFLPGVYFENIFYLGLLLTEFAVILILILALKKKAPWDKEFMLNTAALSTAILPFLLPKMHQRYFFPADLLSIGIGFYSPRLLVVPILFQLTSALSYTPYLWNKVIIPCGWLGVVNLIPIGLLGWTYYQSMQEKEPLVEEEVKAA